MQLRRGRKLYRAKGSRIRKRNRERWESNRTEGRARQRAYYRENAEKLKARSKKNYRKNPKAAIERAKERQRVLRAVAPEILREYKRNTNARRPYKRRARQAHRRARQVDATPWWADRSAIDEIYALADLMTRLLGRTYVVDHIVPLKGKTVCGLHLHVNLQVISEAENSLKSNKVWPGKP
jgi:hypothetical protein